MALVAVVAGCQSTYAIVAKPKPHTFIQPDGRAVTVQLCGDERSHFYLSEDDYLIVEDNNAFYYANIDASGILQKSTMLASEVSQRSAAEKAYLNSVDMSKVFDALQSRAITNTRSSNLFHAPARSGSMAKGVGLFPGNSFPSKGKQKVLVVLVQYTDVSFTLDDPYDYFNRLLTQPGFSDYDGTGSAHDFFVDNSKGQFDPEFVLYGPITLAHNMAYYGGNDWWGNDQHPEEMVIEACEQLDDTVDFSEFDRDNDGYIDNVFVFYAGKGEASYGGADTVWPHSWDVSAATSTPYYFDGVRLDRYACSNEWESSRPDGIGTFVHEFSHVMGLPDLYATSYTGAFTPGAWSALDYGPYNNDGRTPPCYGAFERYALDWVEPTVLDSPCNVTLRDVITNKCCIIPTGDPDEFFLIENRQQKGWDKYIPGHGMLIWHVQYDSGIWSSNTVNNTGSHQYVDIEEADDERNDYSRDGDAFPGTRHITEFTDDTHPSMRTWANKPLDMPITEIKETADGVIKFKIAGGRPDVDPVVVSDPTDITATSFKVTWTSDSNAVFYNVSVYTKMISGEKVIYKYINDWNHKSVGDTLATTITGLEPLTEYFCVVNASNGDDESYDSNEVSAVTGEPTFDLITPVVLEADDVNASWFYANWEPFEGATDYLLSVYTKVRDGEPQYDTCDFTDGLSSLPKGWTSSSRQSFANTAYSGQAVPAVRLSSADAYVQSAKYSDDVCSVSFWHRGSSASSKNSIKVYAVISGRNVEVANVRIVNEVGGAVTTIDQLPEGTNAVRIVYNEVEHKGSVAIDDIVVGWGRPLVNVDFPNYSPIHTGNVTSYKVEGTARDSKYYYRVTAFDGEVYSRVSPEMMVVTASENSGIADVAIDALTVVGRTINVSAAPLTAYTVCDLTGRVFASGKTDAAGHAYINVSSSGVYVVRIANKASKISIK